MQQRNTTQHQQADRYTFTDTQSEDIRIAKAATNSEAQSKNSSIGLPRF